jgi:FtsH-binding integral membrane protein
MDKNMTQNHLGLRNFFIGIYKWMAAGIAVSGLFAYATLVSVQSNGLAVTLLSNKFYFYGIMAVEIALLFGIQMFINGMRPTTAKILFFIYAALSGVTLSSIFLVYNLGSIVGVFIGALAIFAGLAVFGYTTKKNIQGWGTFLMIGMWGVFVSSIVNIFLQSNTFSIVVSAIAVLVFAGLTVYDNQSYKNIYAGLQGDDEIKRYTILGALHMYINFVMMFTHLLNLFGASD